MSEEDFDPQEQHGPIDSSSPFGKGKDADQFAQIRGVFKMIGLQIVHGIIANRKWKQSTKLLMFVAVFFGNLRYNSNKFIEDRSETLYDAFNVTRHATFDEFKEAKDNYIELLDIEEKAFNQTKADLIDKLNQTISENSDNTTAEYDDLQQASLNVTANMTLDSRYPLKREDVKDAFNVAVTAELKEAYDKHNTFYREYDWKKRLHQHISTLIKYRDAVTGSVFSYFPYFMIVFMSFGKYSVVGRQMTTTGLILTIYIAWEIKSPSPSSDKQNMAVRFINSIEHHKWIIKMLGEDLDKWTYSQMTSFLQSVLWQSYFQFAMALSRLYDQSPTAVIDQTIKQIENKSLKALQIFESIATTRTKEVLEKEHSEGIKKSIGDREKLTEERQQHKLDVTQQEHALRKQKEAAEQAERVKDAQSKGGPGWGKANKVDAMFMQNIGGTVARKEEEKKEPQVQTPAPLVEIDPKELEGLSETEKRMRLKEREMENKLKARERELEEKFSKKVAELEAQNKKHEDELALREKEMAEKEKLLVLKEKDPMLHCNPDTLKPLKTLIREEKKRITDVWDNPKVPKAKLMQMLATITWTNQVKGCYQQALKWRGEGKLAYVKERMQKEAEKRGNLTNYLQKIGTVLCYVFIALAAIGFAVPVAAYNYFRHEIAIGEFGFESEEVPDPMQEKVQTPFGEGQGGETPIQDLDDEEDFGEIIPPPPAKEDLDKLKENLRNIYGDSGKAGQEQEGQKQDL